MGEKVRYYLEKLLSVLKVRPLVGGMEISDLVLRFVYFDGKAWRMSGVRLDPGLITSGKIKNYGGFVLALKALKSKTFTGRDLKKRINAIISLSSVSIYSQVFNLPIIEGENLEKAVQLNVQMVSPLDSSQAYSGWQKVGEDRGSLRLEVLSAFVDRSTVDEIRRALLEAGFLAVAVESRALALARLLREQGAGFDIDRPYIMISLDSAGLDFLVIRRGQLYFEYFNPWQDIMDEKGQISMPSFETTIVRSLHQVVNFYGQHWPESLGEVVLSATALTPETEKIIRGNFPLLVRQLKLKFSQDIGPEWFVALGCGLRGLKPRGGDKEMSLSGIGAEEEFRREQLLNFLGFWRLLMPIALSLLLIFFITADLFLIQTHRSLESQSSFGLSGEQGKEIRSLDAKIQEFNRSTALIRSVQKSLMAKHKLWEKIRGLAALNAVTINRFYLQNTVAPMILSGEAKSENQIVGFKKALEADSMFMDINMPLSDIKTSPAGLSFSLNFRMR